MRIACTMPGDFCILCGNSRLKKGDSSRLSYHRFPKNLEKRTQWLRAFQLSADVIKDHSRVCSRHFYGGDPKNGPDPNVGRKFASPITLQGLRELNEDKKKGIIIRLARASRLPQWLLHLQILPVLMLP